MQSRDLVEAHRLVFSAKLYDHQGPIARGGGRTNPPPLTVRVMRNALTGRGLRGSYSTVMPGSHCRSLVGAYRERNVRTERIRS